MRKYFGELVEGYEKRTGALDQGDNLIPNLGYYTGGDFTITMHDLDVTYFPTPYIGTGRFGVVQTNQQGHKWRGAPSPGRKEVERGIGCACPLHQNLGCCLQMWCISSEP